MKSRSLLAQVLAVNAADSGHDPRRPIALDDRVGDAARGREIVVLGLALVATMLGNWLLLRRRFIPLDRLISSMEQIDLATPAQAAARVRPDRQLRGPPARGRDQSDARPPRVARRAAGRAAIEAQERERRRIAQDLHDEVNQALTAVSLRLQASIDRAGGAPPRADRDQAARRPGDGGAAPLARQLRPAVLDDHGLLPALHSQVRDFSNQTGIQAAFNVRGQTRRGSPPEQQLVVYRVTQESLSNVAQHSGAERVDVELSFIGRTGAADHRRRQGVRRTRRDGGLGLSGMRERALLVGGHLSIWSGQGQGTRVELTLA